MGGASYFNEPKLHLTEMATGQSDLDLSSIEQSLFSERRLCQVNIKATNRGEHMMKGKDFGFPSLIGTKLNRKGFEQKSYPSCE